MGLAAMRAIVRNWHELGKDAARAIETDDEPSQKEGCPVLELFMGM